MPAHADLTGSDLHEPKGVSGATSGQVYVANGGGSGAWSKPTAANTSVTDSGGYYSSSTVEDVLQELGPKTHYLHAQLDDVSTASFVLIPIPADCTVNRVTTILHDSISAADATVTVSRGGDSAVLGTLTITQSGSAEGDVDENSSLSNNTVTRSAHKYIKVASDGGSTTTSPLSIEIKVTI